MLKFYKSWRDFSSLCDDSSSLWSFKTFLLCIPWSLHQKISFLELRNSACYFSGTALIFVSFLNPAHDQIFEKEQVRSALSQTAGGTFQLQILLHVMCPETIHWTWAIGGSLRSPCENEDCHCVTGDFMGCQLPKKCSAITNRISGDPGFPMFLFHHPSKRYPLVSSNMAGWKIPYQWKF